MRSSSGTSHPSGVLGPVLPAAEFPCDGRPQSPEPARRPAGAGRGLGSPGRHHHPAPPPVGGPARGTTGSGPAATDADPGTAHWRWEEILANVLGISVPDRAALLSQPWLVVTRAGAPAPEAREIWAAPRDAGPSGAAGPVTVYLSPELHVAGGLWDQFRQAPLAALSGVPAGHYGTLPLQPPTFRAVEQALAAVTGFYARAADTFSGIASHASARGAVTPDDRAQIAGRLETVTFDPQGQLRTLGAYSLAVGRVGDAAARFLTALWDAYSEWARQMAHSPLGAIIQLLNPAGAAKAADVHQIADSRDTRYGDLATPRGWEEVERQAKGQWLSLLTGEAPDGSFSGLDPLGRDALSGLVSQYDAARAVLAPASGWRRPATAGRPFSAFANLPGPGATSRGGPEASHTEDSAARTAAPSFRPRRRPADRSDLGPCE